VGARCAGATLATYLAREGASVLVLDKDAMPSDHVVSTHSISAAGIDVLDEIGVGTAMREITPLTRVLRASLHGSVFDLELPEGRAIYCPRRERLDGLLQNAAVAAGADVLDRTRVVGLVLEGERVAGVRAVTNDRERTIRAGLVVGADGRHSTIARFVRAQEYLEYVGERAGYWGYWNAPAHWTTRSDGRFDAYFARDRDKTGILFTTDHGQLVIGSWPNRSDAFKWRGDPLARLRETLACDPAIGPVIRDAAPIGPLRGVTSERYFFRTGCGPGWALVGDAGHHKDFVIGDGMTEAFLQARSLARAIAEGRDGALVRWWRARDVEALPMYSFGREAAAPDPLPHFTRVALGRASCDPVLRARLFRALDARDLLGATNPAEPLAWALEESLRGRPQALGELIGALPRLLTMLKETGHRRSLLERAIRADQATPGPQRAPFGEAGDSVTELAAG
jgi:flavin-dependent dehydrogenase